MSEARNAVLNTGRNEAENYKSKHRTKEKLDYNDKGVLYFLIVYILKNYSDAEHVRSPEEVMQLTCGIFGTEGEDKKGLEETKIKKDGKRKYSKALYSIPVEKTFKRYLEGLSNFSTLYTYFGDNDHSAQVIRRFLGGSVVQIKRKGKGNQKELFYYFKSDYDARDFDVIRNFTDNDINLDYSITHLTNSDIGYIREICDNISPPSNKKSEMKMQTILSDFPQDWDATWTKFRKYVLNNPCGVDNSDLKEIRPLSGFFNTYHFISDAIEKGQELTIEWNDIEADTTDGNIITTQLKPKRFIWENNRFCVEDEKKQTNNKPMTVRIHDIIDVYRCDQNK